MKQEENIYKEYQRSQSGFTLVFALVLCVIFAGLFITVSYFLKLNTLEAPKDIYKQQAIYLAESGNNRGLARLNVMNLPDIDLGDIEDIGFEDFDDEEFDDDDDFFDDFDDDDFYDDDFEDFEDEEDYELEEERLFLSKIPRYINFYHEEPYFVNIDTGQVITEGQYYYLIQAQQERFQLNQAQGIPDDQQQTEILIQELYFPLPEVNIALIGSFPFQKGEHIEPGYQIVMAEKVPIKFKQKSIVEEYLNYVPEFQEVRPRPVIRGFSPGYAAPGDYIDIYIEGENIEELFPEFSSSSIAVMETGSGIISIAVDEQAKPGRYTLKLGPSKNNFFIIPTVTVSEVPTITDITLSSGQAGNNQFIKMTSREKIENVKITGLDLSPDGKAPIIVADGIGINVDIVSFSRDEAVVNITTKKAQAGTHYLTIFTAGGESNSWIFNVEKATEEAEVDPFVGTYSTVATLLEIKSLPNMPLKSIIEGNATGGTGANRPGNASGGSGRAGGNNRPGGGGGATTGDPGQLKTKSNFDLLRSDLEMVWKIESVATVNKISYKETKVVSRRVPRAEAAIVTNSDIAFGTSSITVSGILEAITRLEDSVATGDTTITVEGEDPDQQDFLSREEGDRPPLVPTGAAVIEDLGLGINFNTPRGRGFKPGGIVAITSLNRSNSFGDYAFVTKVNSNTIDVEAPGFRNGHFIADEVTQFVPAIISPEPISDRDAERSLNPPGAIINLPGKHSFDYVFRTRMDRLANWSNSKTDKTKIPEDIDLDYEGYLGLHIIEGVPSYTGGNALYGQGTLIIDTTLGGINPAGSTVTIGGSSKLPSIFEGVIYIIGDLTIDGPVELAGSVIVNSQRGRSTLRISGAGNIAYDVGSINKGILHIPFTQELRSRTLEKSKGQQEILKGGSK